uniref:Protein croquemort n=1 Tax=Panagrellus redivivus TaxID=6233 RepID=A0A7E4UZ45_PANRE
MPNKSTKRSSCNPLYILGAFACLFGIAACFFWIPFPSIYRAVIESRLKLTIGSDGMPSFATFMWAKPPLRVLMKFYMWNLTNPEEVYFYGAKPTLVEIGPFSVWETEEKHEYEFNEDQTRVWYKNYKKYVFDEAESCSICKYDAPISMINSVGYGALAELADPRFNISKSFQQVFAFGAMLLGEMPFIVKPFGEIVFDGYDDAMLTTAHSEAVYEVSKMLNQTHFNKTTFIPIPVPDMKKMAFFYGYNNTNDEEYVIDTGKKNIKKLGKIYTWANRTELPEDWYSTDECRAIKGSDSGSFEPSGIEKTDRLDVFLSFFCRSLYLEYSRETDVKGVPVYEFTSPRSVFDTTLDENRGMRYVNSEQVNYAPNWPNCGTQMGLNNTCDEVDVDCGSSENLCHTCCNGSFVDGTYLLPPGMYPLVCYPGKLQSPPFTDIMSAPHFAYSPPQVLENIIGMEPRLPEHTPIVIKYEPTAGVPLEVTLQFQISTPMYRNHDFVSSTHLPNVLLPFMWVSATGTVGGALFDNVKLGFVTIPKIIFWVKIASTVITALLGALVVFIIWRRFNGSVKTSEEVLGNC